MASLQSPLACTEMRYCDRRQARHWLLPVEKDVGGQERGNALLVAVEVLAMGIVVGADGGTDFGGCVTAWVVEDCLGNV